MATRLLISFVFMHYIFLTITQAVTFNVSIPYTVEKGTSVATLSPKPGQISRIVNSFGSRLFQIREGHVVVEHDISELLDKNFSLKIQHNIGSNRWFDTIYVQVSDSNSLDSVDGVFAHSEYVGSVMENQESGTEVTGLDSLFDLTHPASYEIVSGGRGLFLIEYTTNNIATGIITTQPLDRDTRSMYTLIVRGQKGPKIEEATVNIIVTNDSSPYFPNSEYSVSVDYATQSSGSVILSIPAKNYDNSANPLRYILTPNSVFGVDSTGNIFLKSIWVSNPEEYHLKLIAVDVHGRESKPVSVKIDLTSQLKYVPKRRVKRQSPSLTSASVSVEERTSTIYNFDSSNLGFTPTYSIVSSSVPGLFRIISQSLIMAESKRLDYEEESQRSMNVVVNITDGDTVIETKTISITVTNINDEFPYFITKPEPYLATVSATTPEDTMVFTLMAIDPDESLAKVEYFLISGGENRFSVNNLNGEITVVGSTTFTLGKEYFLTVEAQDVNATPVQKTPQKNVRILVGERPPQIFEPRYVVDVPENSRAPYLVETIKAHRFQDFDLRYQLRDNLGGDPSAFTITPDGPLGGEVKLIQPLDYENPSQPKDYNLRVIVSEISSSGLSSTVQLLISVTDVNDNDPVFRLSTYTTEREVPENAGINTALLNVTATDSDSGRNAQLTFTVDNPLFAADTVGNSGIIKVNGRLDFDRTLGHRYEFTVVATDNGESPRAGSATVIISVTNVNDEDPEFTTDLKAEVFENANSGQFVHTVHVTDPDGDNVKVYFKDGGRTVTSGPFEITPDTGRVFLRQTLPAGVTHYVLNLTAEDDGSCCDTPDVRRSSEAALIVEIVDVNDNRPVFPDCRNYQQNPPSVKENSEIGSPVFKVTAQDDDQGENGRIQYSFLEPRTQNKFNIDSETGQITVADMINREERDGARDISITIQARDNGQPRLYSLCSFQVLVEDVNDNTPVFTELNYAAQITTEAVGDTSVLRLVANDADSGDNRRVEYSLIQNPDGLFKINNETGILRLAVPLGDRTSVQRLIVMARDHGKPERLNSTANVSVTIKAQLLPPPVWEGDIANNLPILVNETHPLGHMNPIATIKASTDPPGRVNFLFINDGQLPVTQIDPFALYRRPGTSDTMDIYLKSRLDYERIQSYELKIRAAANNAKSDISVKIDVRDENDETPEFRGYNPIALTINGTLTENRADEQSVVTLQAIDNDRSAAFRKLRYSFLPNDQISRNFSINQETGEIKTRTMFDLEAHLPLGVIRFTVQVDDIVPSADPAVPTGRPNSATATVEVTILDVNDNEPKFVKSVWEASVMEDVDIGHSVLLLSARDLDRDSQMEFSIVSAGNDFTVERKSGILKVANLLDFENVNRRFYNLTVQVYDGKFVDTAYVLINVSDANDNPPVFSKNPYEVLNITENDDRVQVIIQVHATDPDLERPNDIEYSLNGPLAEDQTFTIDRKTGRITVTRALDRDYPNGFAVYEFNVLAVDEPNSNNKRTGVSYVRVMPIDVNDNSPVFDTNLIAGSVQEHSTALVGSRVFAVNAIDYDAGVNSQVEYSIIEQVQANGLDIFGININTGQINVITLDRNVLDREVKAEYTLIVKAQDKGNPSQSTEQLITINLSDINDQVPTFTAPKYTATMSENLPAGFSVISVSATDKDVGINAQLIYSLEREYDNRYFSIETRNSTNEGILRVFGKNKIDYEVPALRKFNVTVSVDDVPSPSHKSLTYIEVTVEDFNDNAPLFERASIQKRFYENITLNTEMAVFKANDADSTINAEFEYSIDHGPDSDPLRQFRINENGVVTLVRSLDRETNASYAVTILAIDKGTPPQTGKAVLYIDVLDVNDNAPDFKEDYVVYFEEELEAIQKWPYQLLASDPDTAINGAPFYFALPCNAECCPENPYCNDFNFTFDRSPDNPEGFGKVQTYFRKFDRETQKEYFLPVVMWDSGNPVMTATRSLHIVIKDINDNAHEAALKKILVYSYEGFRAVQDVEIGRVYAKDPDDWDVIYKKFTLAGDMPTYFRLDPVSGMISMNGKPPVGVYTFKVNVFDTELNIGVISEVEITVRGIPSAAVFSSGSVRLNDITARDFVERPHAASGNFGEYDPSKYDKFRTILASKLNVPEDNVEIFSVRDNGETTDVRFAAHGSPWYKPSKLDGLVATNKQDFENGAGITIGMVPIDECLYEICDHGCYNDYIVSDVPKVIPGNSTSFVGVDAYMKSECNTCNGTTSSAHCTCKAAEFPESCRGDFCYNGGTCYTDDWGELRCKCEEGFDGARCQQTKHSFNGDSWALYPALAQCEFGETTLEFITQRRDSLIFYNGPMDNSGPQDFISLQLSNGAPLLRIDHGTGTLDLTIPTLQLADNKWHRIDITSAGKLIKLTVDGCDSAVITEDENSSTEDRSSCEASDKTPGENQFLNVNDLLQMGGTYAQPPFIPQGLQGFKGCIKNFKHLGKLYDLHMGSTGLHKDTQDGCPQETESCGSPNNVDGLTCGENGICIGDLTGGRPTCICKPGWRGDKCDRETPTKDFRNESYIIWDVGFETSPYKNKIQVNFRSRDKDGVLFSAMSAKRLEYLTLQLRDYQLQAVFHSKASTIIKLDNVKASNGHWHTAYLERFGRRLKLYMDHGEGPYSKVTDGESSTMRKLEISPTAVYGGAIVTGLVIQNSPLNDYENSCMSDVRLDGTWFPMQENDITNGVSVIKTQALIDGCVRDDCAGAEDCGLNRVCVALWEDYTCKCAPGFVEGADSVCESACRCLNGGTCVYTAEEERGYRCNCPREYTGPDCESSVSSIVRNATLSDEGMAAILVCVFLLLVLLLAVFLYLKLNKPKEKLMLDDDPYDDIRENIVNYDEDGAGEEDQNAFDINSIRVPVDAAPGLKTPYENTPRRVERPLQSALPPGETPDVGNFIEGRLKDADDDKGAPPYDSVREFAHEGGGSDAGSLSSLNTSVSSGDQDYDYLNDWGPKFAKLADMYGAGQTDED